MSDEDEDVLLTLKNPAGAHDWMSYKISHVAECQVQIVDSSLP